MNPGLIYGLATLVIGLGALIVRYSFKSKCVNVSLCCGLIEIQRDIENEIVEDKLQQNLERGDSSKIISV